MKPSLRHTPAPSGFTLIEVLLTTVLAAALLSVLWTLLSMHLRLFDTGQTKTEQSQLARTLLKQMSDDLHSVVQAAPPIVPLAIPVGLPMVAPPPASNSSSQSATTSSTPTPGGAAGSPQPPAAASGSTPPQAPRSPSAAPQTSAQASSTQASSTQASSTQTKSPQSSLAQSSPGFANSAVGALANRNGSGGNQNGVAVTSSLRPAGLFGTETELQIDVLQSTIAAAEAEPDRRRMGAEAPSRAEDLRTVVYSFASIRDPRHPLSEPRPLLVRREIAWEQAHPAGSGAGRGRSHTLPAGAGQEIDAASSSLDPREENAPDDSSETAPEVVEFGMRYFDGSRWSPEWDSVARQGLPVAVEVAMKLRAFDEPEPTHPLGSDMANDDAKIRQPKLPAYRLVIHLPLATKQPDRARGLSGTADPSGAATPRGADFHGSQR